MELTEEDKANTHAAGEFYASLTQNGPIILPPPTRVDMTVRVRMQDSYASDVDNGKGPVIWRYDGDDGYVNE